MWVCATVSVNDTNALFPRLHVVYLSAMMRGAYTLYVWYCTVVGMYRITNVLTIITI